ncbi:hypothetical protein Psch_03211 [Pelotomaculum schinkii]|uniref:PemK-like protein n=1 Tax=Pelotomaculum schinkii TaxID=78350 RepID=A0A4Y7RCX4_9FIRM|nr:hypothetical protein [Pelotomaculum schinkii]TEB06167.1 hypothetical protein Psch_03211 [Pelotomaculum schinkii]
MVENYKIYLLTSEFHQICDWRSYKITTHGSRPVMILVIEEHNYPDCYCCIPISKDDDKNVKYKNLFDDPKKTDLVYPININKYDNYLLIQNMFYVRKEFIGDPFKVNGKEIVVLNPKRKSEILKRVQKLDILMNKGIISYVPREKVYDIQISYLASKKK